MIYCKGDFVVINGETGVVVLTGDELGGDLGDHTAVWFGTLDNGRPEVWTVPTEYLQRGGVPVQRH